jgi:hypothetical protein
MWTSVSLMDYDGCATSRTLPAAITDRRRHASLADRRSKAVTHKVYGLPSSGYFSVIWAIKSCGVALAEDEAIPPDAQRQFAARMGATTVEVAASYVAMVSRPAEVTEFVKSALQAVGSRERSLAGDRVPS